MKDSVDLILEQWKAERPELDPSPIGIIGRISKLEQHLGLALQEKFAEYTLQRGDFDVLATLRRSGKPYQLTPTVLYQTMMLTSGAMTARLDRLENMGFIQRLAHPTDRRGLLVALTQMGQVLIEKVMVAHLENEKTLLAGLNSKEQQQLANLLRKLLLSLETTA
jgi:DNA-binding MarR family transcriptional regulator